MKERVINEELLDTYINKSGIKSSHIIEKLGVSKQAYYNKKSGRTPFRVSEIYVLCDLLKIPDDIKPDIFYPESKVIS